MILYGEGEIPLHIISHFLSLFLYIIKVEEYKNLFHERVFKMTDTIFTPSRAAVEYCVRYTEHLFHALLEDRSEGFVRENVEKFHEFVASHDDPIDIALSVDARDLDFFYGLAFVLFRHGMGEYPYEVDLQILPSFSELVQMPLDEVAGLFPPPYTKVYREAMATTE
nr:MAG TPA: hypothetical protein [Caudoviricetes sp.]